MQPENKKIPISVLVLLHDDSGNVLLFNRLNPPDFWQSITGSLNSMNEPPFQAALRELAEETGLVLAAQDLRDWHCSTEYEIYAYWRHRYPDGVTRNTEHWFSAQIPQNTPIVLSEHSACEWFPAKQAAEKVFSPSNQEIIEQWINNGFQAAF